MPEQAKFHLKLFAAHNFYSASAVIKRKTLKNACNPLIFAL